MPVITDVHAPTWVKTTPEAHYVLTERVAPPPEIQATLPGGPGR